MKKTLTVLLLVFIMLSFSLSVFADSETTLDSVITCDGKTTVIKQSDDIITVTYTLSNITEGSNYYVLSHTNEIYYDPTFFRYIEDSASVTSGTNIAAIHQEWTDEPNNSITFSGSPLKKWNSVQTVGTFQLRIIATQGESIIYSKDGRCGVASGTDDYALSLNSLTVKIGEDVDYEVEANKYVDGKSIVVVYTNSTDISFTLGESLMYDATAKYKKDGFNKAYALVTDTKGNGTAEDYTDDISFLYIPLDGSYVIEAAGYDINGIGGFTISDVITAYGVFYAEPQYFDGFMPQVLNADVNNDKCVDKNDTDAVKNTYIEGR